MSQAPAGRTENYGTAPFLPPPPSKPGRRPEPQQEPKGGYSVFGPGTYHFHFMLRIEYTGEGITQYVIILDAKRVKAT